MTPRQQGAQAARDGKTLQDCPFTYSQIDPEITMLEYIAQGWQHKQKEWMIGWGRATESMRPDAFVPPSE